MNLSALPHCIGKALCLLGTAFFLLAAASPVKVQAQDQTPFPELGSKKGLQVQMVDDALALGIKHAASNVSLGHLLIGSAKEEEISFASAGKIYRFRAEYVKQLDQQIKPLSDAGVFVYLILLTYPTGDPMKDDVLLHPGAKTSKGYTITGFNTVTPEGKDTLSALIEFLAQRYSGADSKVGRVWGYIVGNEVNSAFMWNNTGKMPVTEAAATYERAVRLVHDAVKKHSAHARVYLSFDHHWAVSMPGVSDQEAYPTRTFLELFAKAAREKGDFEWHVAHHPYPDDLGNPRTWQDKSAWPTEDSPHITFKNLEVACRYMERPELLWQGRPRRIILSEQGIHCLPGAEGEDLQAAGFAYAWEKVSRQSGIDALIWHRQVDHAHEGGLRLGLWENKAGSIADPGRQRRIYDLFKKADTAEWSAAASFALPFIGLKSWDELER